MYARVYYILYCVYDVVVRKFTLAISSLDEFLANVNMKFMFAMSSSVRLSVVCLSVTFVHPTQPIEIFGNVSAPFNTLVT